MPLSRKSRAMSCCWMGSSREPSLTIAVRYVDSQLLLFRIFGATRGPDEPTLMVT